MQPATTTSAIPFPHLQKHNFISLTTFRKSGDPVPTPVWFAQEGDHLYVMTDPDSGKVKRIRHNAQVEVAPCKVNGEIIGASAEAMARVLSTEEGKHADTVLSKKYGIQKTLFTLMNRLRGKHFAYLEITHM